MAPCDMKPKVNSSVYQFTSSTDQKRFTTNKSVDRDLMGRLQPPAPLLLFFQKKINLLVGGNEKIKQNKIK